MDDFGAFSALEQRRSDDATASAYASAFADAGAPKDIRGQMPE